MENKALISGTVDVIARGFLSLAREVSSHEQFAQQVTALAVEDEFSRFKVWAGNTAAHRRGRRSLEYRLRDAERLRLEVNNSLNELDEIIHDMIAIVKGEKVPWEMEQIDSDSDSDSISSDPDSDPEYDTELKQLFTSIKTSISGLFRLSMAIRNPAPTSQFESTILIDKSIYQEYDVLHVQAKFPKCADYLIERLGRAISTRRQYLTYREEHHNKLAKDVEKLGLEDSKTEFTTNSTEVTAVQRQNSLNVVTEDDSASQTSFATSVNAAIRIPPIPKAASGQDFFECPLCFMIISVDTKHAWKQHVYRDLHPYCCTSKECATAGRLFDSRHEWFNHELAHRRTWECIEGCNKTFPDLASFQEHVGRKHQDLVDLLPVMGSTSARGASLSSQVECSLCGLNVTLKSYKRHVAAHQQQLALFALPCNLDETEDDDDDDDDDDDEENEVADDMSIRVEENSEEEETFAVLDGENPENTEAMTAEDYMNADETTTQNPYADMIHGHAIEGSRIPIELDDSGSAHSGRSSQDILSLQTVETGNSNETRVRVNASVSPSLAFDGDMEGRTLRLVPSENGMTDVLIGDARGEARSLHTTKGIEKDVNALHFSDMATAPVLKEPWPTVNEHFTPSSDNRLAQKEATLQRLKERLDRETRKDEREDDHQHSVSGLDQTPSRGQEPVSKEAIHDAARLDPDSRANMRAGREEREVESEHSLIAETSKILEEERIVEWLRERLKRFEEERKTEKRKRGKVLKGEEVPGVDEDERRVIIAENEAKKYRERRADRERERIEEENRKEILEAGGDEARNRILAKREREMIEFEEDVDRIIQNRIKMQHEKEMRLKIEEERKKAVDQGKYDEFLGKQKAKTNEEEKKEEGLEQSMRGRLLKFGFTENEIQDLTDPKRSQGKLQLAPQPTYARIDKQHIEIETLDYYDIPYEWDRVDPSYVIVLRELSQRECDVLLEHTRRLRHDRTSKKEHVFDGAGEKEYGPGSQKGQKAR